jgi:hypothetical protein
MNIKPLLLLVFGLWVGSSLLAQDWSLMGRLVHENDSSPLQGAQILLWQEGARPQGQITNEKGMFRFSGLSAGAYTLRASLSGFDTLQQVITLDRARTFLGVASLAPRSYDLEQVRIEAERAAGQQKGDTTEFNASAFTTNPDATAEQLIQKMPGVLMQNGQVSAQGEQVQQVLVDGRPFFGNDPTAALRNLPAEVIDKIQVFDQQSEQAQATGFDDGNTTKTLNIITKPETRNGTFGRAYAGYGTDERYQAGTSLNFFQGDRRVSIVGQTNNINRQNFAPEDLMGVASSGGSRRGGRGGRGGGGGSNVGDFLVGDQGGISNTHALGLNYSDKWGKAVTLSGSYFFNLSDNENSSRLSQLYLANGDTGQVYAENSLSTSRNLNHRANLRMEIDLNENDRLVIRPRATWQTNDGQEHSESGTQLGNNVLNASLSGFSSNLSALNVSNTLLYRHRFGESQRTLSFRLQTDYKPQNGRNFLTSGLQYFSEPARLDSLDQSATLLSEGWGIGTELSYSAPLGERAMLELNYSYAPEWNDAAQETYHFDPGLESYNRLDTLLSNTFTNTYTAHELGTSLRYRGEKGFLMARISYQRSTLENSQVFPYTAELNRTFHALLPMLVFRYAFSRESNVRIIYRSRTSAPSVANLQEVLDNSNPLQLSTGNSSLKQYTDHRLIFRYGRTQTSKSRVLFAMGNMQYSDNYIGRETFIAARDTLLPGNIFVPRGGQLTRPVNLDGYWRASTFLTYSFPLQAIKSQVNANLSLGYTRTPGLLNDQLNIANTGTAGVDLVLSSNINENVDFTLSSQTQANTVLNGLNVDLNNEYLSQTSSARVNLMFGPGIVVRSQLSHQLYQGLSESFNQSYWLWNGGVAKKLFKNRRGELELSVFDLLRQNTSVSRSVNDIYIQDLETTVLQRYVMLTFTYQLRQFETPDRPDGPPPGMRPGFGPPQGGPPPGGRP